MRRFLQRWLSFLLEEISILFFAIWETNRIEIYSYHNPKRICDVRKVDHKLWKHDPALSYIWWPQATLLNQIRLNSNINSITFHCLKNQEPVIRNILQRFNISISQKWSNKMLSKRDKKCSSVSRQRVEFIWPRMHNFYCWTHTKQLALGHTYIHTDETTDAWTDRLGSSKSYLHWKGMPCDCLDSPRQSGVWYDIWGLQRPLNKAN